MRVRTGAEVVLPVVVVVRVLTASHLFEQPCCPWTTDTSEALVLRQQLMLTPLMTSWDDE